MLNKETEYTYVTSKDADVENGDFGSNAFDDISPNAVINIGAVEGEIAGAPWGAPNGVTINYGVREGA